MACLAIVMASGNAAAENLLENPGFENASRQIIVDWRRTPQPAAADSVAVVRDAAAAHAGEVCVRLEGPGPAGLMQRVHRPERPPRVFPGRTYRVQAYARGQDAVLDIAFDVSRRDGTVPTGIQRRVSFKTTREWRPVAATLPIPDGADIAWLAVRFETRGGAPVYLDDVSLHSDRAAHVRYLHSLNRLVVRVDPAFARGQRALPAELRLKAAIHVFGPETNRAVPILAATLADIGTREAVWRASTESLPEGAYTVRVRVLDHAGAEVGREDDWFEKRHFNWMDAPRGVGDDVPAGYYVPLQIKARNLSLWGREYRFGPSGLLAGVTSQGREWLLHPMEWLGEIDGRPAVVEVERPFAFTRRTDAEARGSARLKLGGATLDLSVSVEYDGLVTYRLTCAPHAGTATIGRLRVKAPLDGRRCQYYSSDGCPWQAGPPGRPDDAVYLFQDLDPSTNTAFYYDVLPRRDGRVFNGMDHQQIQHLSATFNGLFWVGDDETCFCYAADSDKGWALRDDAPAVEAWRQGDELALWLNLLDREVTLDAPRTLEFAFQAGPTKARPEGWRGIQEPGFPDDHPLQVIPIGIGGDETMFGGTHFIHPGLTPELREKSREKIAKVVAGGGKAAVGYHYWGTVPKGMPETRVFRGEWNIDREVWARATEVRHRLGGWEKRIFGEDQDLYILLYVTPVPSYVDFISYAYDEALRHTALAGFYDDCGLPVPLHDEELALGFTRDDGREVWSSGLWIYRDRLKRAACLNARHNRPNLLRDSQHVRAHYLPAHGFSGIWAPCEHGYYNPFADRDNIEFYGSLDRYAAFNPARAFGQIAMIGLSSGWMSMDLPGRARRDEAPVFAGDTRGMMMLTLLNDQDVGSFGYRDFRVVCGLRHARNGFKPWENGVVFVGHWASDAWVRADRPGIKVSLYRRPDAVLFVLGNLGADETEAAVRPDWGKLQLDPARLSVVNAETGGSIPVGDGVFRIRVPRHDVRLVVAGPVGQHVDPAAGRPLDAGLPRPASVLDALGDAFAGPALGPGWVQDVHDGAAGVWMLDGRLCVQGSQYGYAHVRREVNDDNISAQCLIMRAWTGGMDAWGGSLFLYWANGEYAQATPGTSEGKFFYRLSGVGDRRGCAIGRRAVPGWYPHFPNWVKIALTPETVAFHSSADGKSWTLDWEVKRGDRHKGAPRFILLGNGSAGPEPLLKNVHPRHFSPRHGRQTFFSDLVVGRTE